MGKEYKIQEGGINIVSKMIFSILCISGVLFLLSAAGCETLEKIAEGVKKTDRQGYILAFKERNMDRIIVRWSKYGDNWTDSAILDVPIASPYPGVGAAATELDFDRMIAWKNQDGYLEVMWGSAVAADFREDGWQQSAIPTLSAPSVIRWADDQWLVAYLTPDYKVGVHIFDCENEQFVATDYAPTVAQGNSNVWGRPALVRLGDNVVLAWFREGSIRLAVGDISNSGIPNWISTSSFTPADQIEGDEYGNIISNLTLTHDHNRFYLGFTRRPFTGGLVRHDFHLYSSTDGISWSFEVRRLRIPQTASVNIAGRSDSSIIVAVVGAPASASGSPILEVFRDHRVAGGGPPWITDLTSVFGPYTPEWGQFALVSVGRPPVEGSAP